MKGAKQLRDMIYSILENSNSVSGVTLKNSPNNSTLLLEQANGNLPIGKNENPELIRYAADIIRKYADGLSHDDRSVKEICEENSQNIA